MLKHDTSISSDFISPYKYSYFNGRYLRFFYNAKTNKIYPEYITVDFADLERRKWYRLINELLRGIKPKSISTMVDGE